MGRHSRITPSCAGVSVSACGSRWPLMPARNLHPRVSGADRARRPAYRYQQRLLPRRNGRAEPVPARTGHNQSATLVKVLRYRFYGFRAGHRRVPEVRLRNRLGGSCLMQRIVPPRTKPLIPLMEVEEMALPRGVAQASNINGLRLTTLPCPATDFQCFFGDSYNPFCRPSFAGRV